MHQSDRVGGLIPCPHWRDCGIPSGGCCALGLYGGSPSHGVCRAVCLKLPPAPAPEHPPPPRTIGPRVTGADASPSVAAMLAKVPLEKLGDGVAKAIETFGLDRVARWYERVSGKKCDCPRRRRRLNAIGAGLKRRLAGG